MSCYYPLVALDYGENPENPGKKIVKIGKVHPEDSIASLRSKYGDMLLLIPCGSCLGCKIDKSRDWAVRAVLEMQYHYSSCFLTLTYEDNFLHKSRRLQKKHIQDFHKRLRKLGYKFKFLCAGEYGPLTHREHWHEILFGVDFRQEFDCKSWYVGELGEKTWHCDELDKIWQKGRVIIGDATFQSVAYVARYTTKKIGDDDSCLMVSNRPGLGKQYLLDNFDKILKYDCVIGTFGEKHVAQVPRYFNSWLRLNYPEEFEKLVERRIKIGHLQDCSAMSAFGAFNVEDMWQYQAEIADKRYKRLKRGDI